MYNCLHQEQAVAEHIDEVATDDDNKEPVRCSIVPHFEQTSEDEQELDNDQDQDGVAVEVVYFVIISKIFLVFEGFFLFVGDVDCVVDYR